MALASMPKLMEGVIDQKYPDSREVKRNPDGRTRYMRAGVRLMETPLLWKFPAEDIVCCYSTTCPDSSVRGRAVVGDIILSE
ncbi:MAG: hypothetical protein ACRD7E_21395 [Bryobacteraceae bacterium]